MNMRSFNAVFCLSTALMIPFFSFNVLRAEDSNQWPRWRGPGAYGSIEANDFPVTLDESTLLWKAPLPGKGCSTPIVWNEFLYLTAPVEEKDALLCFDWNGEEQWSTAFEKEDAGKHRNASGCNASPVTDGDLVFAYFKSGTLAAVTMDGEVRWEIDIVERYGPEDRFWDQGTSPVLTKNHVILARMHAGDSWVAAFDKATGELAWKQPRNYETPVEADQCYTTPLVIEFQGKQAVLVWGAQHVTIHDAATGEVLWACGGFNPEGKKLWPAISNPVIVGETLVLCYGRNDRRQPRLHGLRLAGSGDVTETCRLWSRDDTGAFVPSPVAWRRHVYLVRDGGEVECIDPTSGKTLWQETLPKSRSDFYASPMIAGRKLYAVREDGVAFVMSVTSASCEILSENDLEEPVIGSPVAVRGRLFIRGEKHLFCFASP